MFFFFTCSRGCENSSSASYCLHLLLRLGNAMFKKRSRPTALRDKDVTEAEEQTNVQDLLAVRKLRKPQSGTDLERFNRGETTTTVEAPGLQSTNHE